MPDQTRVTPKNAFDPYPWDYYDGYADPDDYPPDHDSDIRYCPMCGKEYEDFSDLGCEYCDVRYPGYGILL